MTAKQARKYPTYILMTEDKEILWFGPSTPSAAQQTAAYEAAQLGKAVFFAKVEGVASSLTGQPLKATGPAASKSKLAERK